MIHIRFCLCTLQGGGSKSGIKTQNLLEFPEELYDPCVSNLTLCGSVDTRSTQSKYCFILSSMHHYLVVRTEEHAHLPTCLRRIMGTSVKVACNNAGSLSFLMDKRSIVCIVFSC
jgi:hypothetical protein